MFFFTQAQPVRVNMSPDNFVVAASRSGPLVMASTGEFLRRAVYLPSGLLTVKAARFRRIVTLMWRMPGGLFLGIAFRVESEANMGCLLRPIASDTIERQSTASTVMPFGTLNSGSTRRPKRHSQTNGSISNLSSAVELAESS